MTRQRLHLITMTLKNGRGIDIKQIFDNSKFKLLLVFGSLIFFLKSGPVFADKLQFAGFALKNNGLPGEWQESCGIQKVRLRRELRQVSSTLNLR